MPTCGGTDRQDDVLGGCPEEAAAVAGYVRHVLSAAPVTPEYSDALNAALTLPGYVLSTVPRARWALLTCTCCAAAGGRWEHAVPAAAGMELFIAAGDILDDAEDCEEGPLQTLLGAPRALNVSTGLLLLADACLLAGPRGREAARILRDAGLRACGGQHADLAGETQRRTRLEEAVAVTALKSASLVAAACALGAHSAAAGARLGRLCASYGWHLGMAVQLADDIADIHPDATHRTDIALGRPTLPLAYAALQESGGGGLVDDARTRADLRTNGAAYLTWAVAETHRRLAADIVGALGADPETRRRLLAFLPTLG